MDELLGLVGPYLLWAIGVGGLVYPWRFFSKSRKRFVELYACIVVGIAAGWAETHGLEGIRNGLVIGAMAMPALMRARRDNPQGARNEDDSEHEGTGGDHERSEVEDPGNPG